MADESWIMQEVLSKVELLNEENSRLKKQLEEMSRKLAAYEESLANEFRDGIDATSTQRSTPDSKRWSQSHALSSPVLGGTAITRKALRSRRKLVLRNTGGEVSGLSSNSEGASDQQGQRTEGAAPALPNQTYDPDETMFDVPAAAPTNNQPASEAGWNQEAEERPLSPPDILTTSYDRAPEWKERYNKEPPKYAYQHSPVRKKAEKKLCAGTTCHKCDGVYRAFLPDDATDTQVQDLVNKVSKHRSRHGLQVKRSKTPPGFYDIHFPPTQELLKKQMEG